MNIMRTLCIILSIALISCSQKESSTPLAAEPASITKLADTLGKTVTQEMGNQILDVGTDFTIQVHPDSMKFSSSYDGYVALPVELANEIRIHLGENELELEKDQNKYYVYKSIIIDKDRSLKILTNGAKYGYNTMYATLIDDNKTNLLSIIPVGKLEGDVGSYYVVKSTIYNNQERLIIGVYKKSHTDDFSMGFIEGVYKIGHDSLLIYKVTRENIELVDAKSGI